MPIVAYVAILMKLLRCIVGSRIETLTAKDSKYDFCRVLDLACTEPVAVVKHRRLVVIVMAERS